MTGKRRREEPIAARLDDLVHVEITSRREWRSWLRANHEGESIWLVTYKQSVRPELHVEYDAVVEEALCFGWVDGQIRKVDAERTKHLLSPRKAGSTWSKLNKDRIAKLERTGLVEPAGRRVVERAKEDGSWTILDDVERLEEPDDLRDALDAVPTARTHWDAFPPSVRKAMLWWIKSAKRLPTRRTRLETVVTEASEGRRAKG